MMGNRILFEGLLQQVKDCKVTTLRDSLLYRKEDIIRDVCHGDAGNMLEDDNNKMRNVISDLFKRCIDEDGIEVEEVVSMLNLLISKEHGFNFPVYEAFQNLDEETSKRFEDYVLDHPESRLGLVKRWINGDRDVDMGAEDRDSSSNSSESDSYSESDDDVETSERETGSGMGNVSPVIIPGLAEPGDVVLRSPPKGREVDQGNRRTIASLFRSDSSSSSQSDSESDDAETSQRPTLPTFFAGRGNASPVIIPGLPENPRPMPPSLLSARPNVLNVTGDASTLRRREVPGAAVRRGNNNPAVRSNVFAALNLEKDDQNRRGLVPKIQPLMPPAHNPYNRDIEGAGKYQGPKDSNPKYEHDLQEMLDDGERNSGNKVIPKYEGKGVIVSKYQTPPYSEEFGQSPPRVISLGQIEVVRQGIIEARAQKIAEIAEQQAKIAKEQADLAEKLRAEMEALLAVTDNIYSPQPPSNLYQQQELEDSLDDFGFGAGFANDVNTSYEDGDSLEEDSLEKILAEAESRRKSNKVVPTQATSSNAVVQVPRRAGGIEENPYEKYLERDNDTKVVPTQATSSNAVVQVPRRAGGAEENLYKRYLERRDDDTPAKILKPSVVDNFGQLKNQVGGQEQ